MPEHPDDAAAATHDATGIAPDDARAAVPDGFRCGLVAIVGRPNVGKSTLLNRLVGQKISITSRKAQTTRHRIVGIVARPTAQFVFVDTPGVQSRHRSVLHKSMERAVREGMSGVSCIVFVVEAGRYGPEDAAVAKLLPNEVPVVLAINKVDRLRDKSRLVPYIEARAAERSWAAVVPVSAQTGLQLDPLLDEIERCLPESPPLYPDDAPTDRSERFLVAELIREKVFRQLGDELPYSMTVLIDRFVEEPRTDRSAHGGRFCRIAATIVVERASHKAMLIGAGGERLKRIGTDARVDIEKLLDAPCHLELWVKVKSGWADDPALVKSYGYD